MIIINKEYINSIPKYIDSNGCWIPSELKPQSNGYIHIKINGLRYALHRLSMSIFHDVDYYNSKIDTRHSAVCDRACFNYEHLKSGSQRDNAQDIIAHGRNANLNKECCSKCGGPYRKHRIKSGPRKGETFRSCILCVRERDRKRKKK